ncbi:DUF3426 domain-containing protein [Desulfococcaceae bacterium HSG8]|nr:DUF3426 domain-containing protein [Desulfococcaceae bacterium HSG8]
MDGPLNTVRNTLGKIPYVGDFIKPSDSGEITAIEDTIEGRFIKNPNTGVLFVITGKVKNKYSDARDFVEVRGNLYTKNKATVKQANAYCGNILSDEELSSLDPDTIKKRLSNPKIKVSAGKLMPFMVVFYDLPNNLDEFTVEILGSKPQG